MTRQRKILAIAAMVAGGLLPSAFGRGATAAQTTATVKVDCSKGQSINKALADKKDERSLIVEIEGMCNENVILTRDRVTLRGANPSTDGIQAESNVAPIDSALWVRGAHEVTIENLKLTGGYAGLLASEASTLFLGMFNCRLEGNSAYGVLLESSSTLRAEDTVLTSNGSFNATAYAGSVFWCVRCTLSDPLGSGAPNINASSSSTVILTANTLTNGGIQVSGGAFLTVVDSTIDARSPGTSVFGTRSAVVNLTRVQVSGPMRFFQSSNAVLLGVTQTGSGSPNLVDENAFVKIGDASPATGGPPTIPSTVLGFSIQNFSNGSLLQTSQINGNLNCGPGANVFCANPANVSGTSNCALCPKP